MAPPIQCSDEEPIDDIVARASSGDDDAWRELVDRYARRVGAMIVGRTGDPELAEELTQSVFVTVAEHVMNGRYQEQGRFESWLFRIAMNRLRDDRRRRRRVTESIQNDSLVQDAPDHTSLPSNEQLRDALNTLSDADREVISLRHHAQLDFKAIAQLLDAPLGTVLARHHRALHKLRTAMNEAHA